MKMVSPVLPPCAGDKLGSKDLAAHVVPTFHHSTKLTPKHQQNQSQDKKNWGGVRTVVNIFFKHMCGQ